MVRNPVFYGILVRKPRGKVMRSLQGSGCTPFANRPEFDLIQIGVDDSFDDLMSSFARLKQTGIEWSRSGAPYCPMQPLLIRSKGEHTSASLRAVTWR